MSYDLDWLENEELEKESLQEEKKIEKKLISPGQKKTVERLIGPRIKLIGDKELNKTEMCDYIAKYIVENKQNFTLDWLRGQKLTFESVNEIRKKS